MAFNERSVLRGVLLDIDGVLHIGMQPIPGAAETINWLTHNGYAVQFITNTTIMSRSTLARRLQQIGLPVEESRLLTAPAATAQYLRQHYPGKRVWMLTKGDTGSDFSGIDLVDLQDTSADVVVIGGAEELLTYEAMNHAFRLLMDGAALLAMHTNLYWRTAAGLQLDSGAYVRALELAAGKPAVVLGKPDRAFFEQALLSIGVSAREAVMVGDDIENDIAGAQHAGLRGILVLSGKHRADSPLLAKIHPDALLSSVAELPGYLDAQSGAASKTS
jgi:HAD superfamily hydrolase (TIGR01458 family)